MRRKRKKQEDQENLDRWLLTYADLITLLLAFFVVMYSMSQVDAKKFGKITQALSGILRGGPSVMKNPEMDWDTGHGLLKLGNLKMIQQRIDNKFQHMNQIKGIETEITERGLVIHIWESVLFDEGSANMQPQALEVLDQIASVMSTVMRRIAFRRLATVPFVPFGPTIR